MKTKQLLFFILLLVGYVNKSSAQSSQFNVNEYKQFLENNKNISSSQLLQKYSANLFQNDINTNWDDALFHDSIDIKYELTNYEKQLISKNGFVVTERKSLPSFGEQFADIYHKDLPVYISSDAILHAFHSSYDKILKNTELSILIKDVKNLLESMHSKMPELTAKYSSNSAMTKMLKDVDVYLTVPVKLIGGTIQPFYNGNSSSVNDLISKIDSYSAYEIPLFSDSPKKIDFSQFKPRGHYDDENYPQLAKYFKTMMWLGRIELYLIAPKSLIPVPFVDVQRQIIDATLITELIDLANVQDLYNEIDFIIRTFVGEQDNVTLLDYNSVLSSINVSNSSALLDSLKVIEFQDTLKTKSFADQKILSQILMSDPMAPDSIIPASAFMLFGQRFVIDSYVTASVVYDKIIDNGVPQKRMLPSTLDILFALGNDASAQLLQPELDKYKYSKNLAGLRYLIDSYNFDFWNNSIYNLWLNSIRTLNPPSDRSAFPTFMQTAAWWQQKMNTQLASWTELRHDNLLYAKQSYSGGVTCSYPNSYVEPIPKFFNSISVLAQNTLVKLNQISAFDKFALENFNIYFTKLSSISDTLSNIAQKELNKELLSLEETSFLKRLLFNNPNQVCGAPRHVGWYSQLYFGNNSNEFKKQDYLVADIHTAPTDEFGNAVGWVKHAGTGPIDLAIIVAKTVDNKSVAFVGPVSSYYEYTSTNFYRLTDSDWKDTYLQQSLRPNWVNLYLANKTGDSKGESISLLTDVNENSNTDLELPENYLTAQNYPNPFNPTTVISFAIPQKLAGKKTTLTIYNIQGEVIKTLLSERLQAGTYLSRWDGRNKSNNKVSSGVYFYEVKVGMQKYVGKMNLMK